MLKKKFTFMMIPGSSGISRQINIPLIAIYLSVAGVLTLLLASFFLSAQFFSDRVTDNQLEQLRQENANLQTKFEQMRWNLAEVETRYATLVEKEEAIRAIFELPEINDEERQLGIGGPEPPSLAVMTPGKKSAYLTELEVDGLLTLSKFELEKFGEVEEALLSIEDRLRHTPSIWPTKGWLSRGYGMKHDPFTGYKQLHRGIDLANRTGTPVIATANGRISKVTRATGLGKLIVINHGYGFETRYGHLSEISVKRGQKVKRGDVIGLMGSTGYSTGPHLHFEVIRNGKFLDPREYILNEK
ncbi:MAG: M23 family metallopeptidase [bacterium]|nr:M23 family metallopeptidase [bacterium]